MTAPQAPRIVLLHALRESVEPSNIAMAKDWPDAVCINILDDSLSRDMQSDGGLTADIVERFLALGRYADRLHCEAILFTCSAFGPAIEAVARNLPHLPVHKPNAAMLMKVANFRRIGLVASYKPTLSSMIPEFPAGCEIVPCFVEGALLALQRGNGALHDDLVAQAVAGLGTCDVVVLAQYSLARAEKKIKENSNIKVISTISSAVAELKKDWVRRSHKLDA